jgi:hypothetical protein
MVAMNKAAIGMAVFLEDAESYQHAMVLFKARVPATIYVTSDGEYPVAARGESSSPDATVEYWFDQGVFRRMGRRRRRVGTLSILDTRQRPFRTLQRQHRSREMVNQSINQSSINLLEPI